MNKKVIFSIIVALVLGGGIIAGVYLVSKNQDIREKAAPATSLSFNPSTQNLKQGQGLSTSVKMDTGENSVTGIDIEITFNPAVFQISQLSPTSSIAVFTNVITNQIDNTGGKARFSAFTIDKTKAVKGNVSIITISGTVVAGAPVGAYQISFGPLTNIAATLEGQNVVINKTASTINVAVASAAGGATATPTSQPQATSTPTVTSVATATATSNLGGGGGYTATPTPALPVAGVSLPFMLSAGLGVGLLLLSALAGIAI